MGDTFGEGTSGEVVATEIEWFDDSILSSCLTERVLKRGLTNWIDLFLASEIHRLVEERG